MEDHTQNATHSANLVEWPHESELENQHQLQDLLQSGAPGHHLLCDIPQDWLNVLHSGYDPPSVGEFFLKTREMPATYMYQFVTVDKDNNTVAMRNIFGRTDSVFRPGDCNAEVTIHPLDPFEFIRAQVFSHREGWLLNGPLDDAELADDDSVFIDQADSQQQMAMSKVTVRNTTAALVHKQAELPTLHVTWPTMPVNYNWRRVWMWVWALYRDKKVSSFLWRAVHCKLQLGHDRRRYSNATSCAFCPDQMETYEHFYHSCPATNGLWTWFRLVWQQTSGYQLPDSFSTKLFCSIPSRIFRGARLRWMVLSVAHGELLYSLWLQRCRAVHDIADAQTQMSKQMLVVVARHRINRALEAVLHNKRWRCESLSRLCSKLRTKMQEIAP